MTRLEEPEHPSDDDGGDPQAARDFWLGFIVGGYTVVCLVASFTGGVVLVGGR